MPEDILRAIYDPEAFREEGHRLIDLISDHLQLSSTGEGLVFPGLKPDEMLSFWERFGQENHNPEELFTATLSQSINLHHPGYIGHQVVPPAPLAVLAELLGAYLNNGMAVYEMGPASTAMERLVIRKLCEWMNLGPEWGGFLSSGGSLGNLTALLTARKMTLKEGEFSKAAILVSEQAHYSISRAAMIMGLPSANLITVPVDKNFGINPELLEETYQNTLARGLRPFAIVGSACTTSTGSYDPLNAIADLAEKHGMWSHVDAAHGAIARMLQEFAFLVDGMERADSVVIDFHKMFLVPALTTAVLYRNEASSFATFSQEAEYLLRSSESQEWYNSGNRTIECTKLMMGLRVFTPMYIYGREAFEAYGRTCFRNCRDFAAMLEADSDFELAMPPQSNILCFRLRKATDRDTIAIREALLREGKFYIVQTKINGSAFFRITVMNPFTGIADFNALMKYLKSLSRELE
jgi:L-2,4-diaminobutyrate decarboxylase